MVTTPKMLLDLMYIMQNYSLLLFYAQTFTPKHLQTQTFKVTAPNATNITFIVYK